ncbi:MAG: topoisomerase [Candidatus Parabeggiatoa sp. nov. 2]|nr:MAG: hypothetical protein B6247_06365 [Beggiatoa sp. 4572_84]RKZ63265.1 MAG: topoisomerase [Gammaproteobacteria bacterium]
MSWTILGLIVFAVLAALVVLKLVQNKTDATSEYPYHKEGLLNKTDATSEYPYQKQGLLFSPAERSFLSVLSQVVREDIQVFGKVRVADVITPRKNMSRREWQKAFNKISAKHFDFLLCEKTDVSIICAIELDDKSHQSNRRKSRETFLENACRSAGVPLARFPVRATYNISEIKKALSEYTSSSETAKSFSEGICQTDETEKKICPKCSSKMVKRKARKGAHAGKEFWGCSSYPKCKYIEPINT